MVDAFQRLGQTINKKFGGAVFRKQINIILYSLTITLLVWFFQPVVLAEQNGNEKFPVEVIKDGLAFKRVGAGYRRFFFMKAFDASFYTVGNISSEQILNDVPKYLEVEYHVGIPAKSLTEYTISHIRLNVNQDEFLKLHDELELMGKYFVDLKPNDRFSLMYLPETGTQFAHNGKVTGIIAGEEFGRALFSVWIGSKPFDPNLRKKILGLSNQKT